MAALEDEAAEGTNPGRPIADLEAELSDIKAQITEIGAEFTGKRMTKDVKERWNRLNAQADDLQETIDENKLVEERIADLAGKGQVESSVDDFQIKRPGSPTGGDIYDLS